MKVTMGNRQAKAALDALSVGIDMMQDAIDHDGREAEYKQADVDLAVEVWRKMDAALKESE